MTWPKGQHLQNGKYVIEATLGQGGFGITYKALHTGSTQWVVIKTPNEHLQNDSEYEKYVDRFRKEGQLMARLEGSHPNIVGIKDTFWEGRIPCLVMNYVPGETLSQVVKRRGKLPEYEAVRAARQIGGALIEVHRLGVVHRDVHPGNIILRSDDGNAILIDFGISKEIIPSTQTSTSHAWNERFAPYEQRHGGRNQTVDKAVDIYSLSATLYYLVTGQFPTPSLLRKLDNAPLLPPKRYCSISDPLNQAILWGMELEAKDRPQSLDVWIDSLTPAKPPPTPVVKPGTAAARTPQRRSGQSPPLNGQMDGTTWTWLIIAVIFYVMAGWSLSYTGAPFWGGAVAVAGAMVVAAPGIVPEAWTWAVALGLRLEFDEAVAGAMVVTWILAAALGLALGPSGAWVRAVDWSFDFAALLGLTGLGAKSLALAWGFTWIGGWAMGLALGLTGTGERLLNSFSRLHTFLILTAASWSALGLGWMLSLIFPHTME